MSRMNINDFPERNEEGASIRSGSALISIGYTGAANENGDRPGTLSIHEGGEEIDLCHVIIGADGNVRERAMDGFYRAMELFEVMTKSGD